MGFVLYIKHQHLLTAGLSFSTVLAVIDLLWSSIIFALAIDFLCCFPTVLNNTSVPCCVCDFTTWCAEFRDVVTEAVVFKSSSL
jgi:hypothetical protein